MAFILGSIMVVTQAIFDVLVYVIATFVAAVLNHPVMTDALVNVIVKGVSGFVRQPDLDDHLLVANESLGRTRDEIAHKAGKDLPKVTGSFIKGLLHIKRKHGRSDDKYESDSSDDEPRPGDLKGQEGEETPDQVTFQKLDEAVVSDDSENGPGKNRTGTTLI
jgi:hypothetical protein